MKKKTKLLSKLGTNNLHMNLINSNVNKQINSVNLVIFFRKKKSMLGKSIQLPLGIVRDRSKEKLIKLSRQITERMFYLINFPILVL